MFMLERLTDDVWIEQRPLRFFGLETGTRMTVVRLNGGGLFVHSPVALDDTLRATVDALGPVTAIIAPSRFHHLYVGEWAAAYPSAPPRLLVLDLVLGRRERREMNGGERRYRWNVYSRS